ncbi:crotonase/enoyl-CoA hydratase family protein [Antarcticirhabdus aurantiaca]|uniref:Crotonase/enoyl-CoA hydratase family protein n=1 Tax=Antarcticirhabdus aurantiaca TaxID=2606717 RepID=A0ACD4NSU0_9HYPH|nr:crotonase/enoyl-CoA hydratase family protein [Antarcticirhabdus aurantiaca]WAJ29818.1 crotonase/enoyl-CoA hydratase family protein [Jeongeuplla avenae]
MSDHVETRREDGVLVLRMNRPDKKNALTRAMYAALTAGLAEAEGDDAIAATVILGLPGTFSAGNDIADFAAIAAGGEAPSEVRGFLHGLARATKPLVAGVDGLAIGIGTTLLMHCDVVVASAGSTFRTPFLDLGLTPEAGSSLLGPRLMGAQRAFALLVLGEAFGAEEARQANIVTRVVEADAEGAALDAARRLARKPRGALLAARALLRGDPDETVRRIDDEIELFAERLRSPEARAAFAAFLKR